MRHYVELLTAWGISFVFWGLILWATWTIYTAKACQTTGGAHHSVPSFRYNPLTGRIE